jgi:hypothetical protein
MVSLYPLFADYRMYLIVTDNPYIAGAVACAAASAISLSAKGRPILADMTKGTDRGRGNTKSKIRLSKLEWQLARDRVSNEGDYYVRAKNRFWD